MILSHPDLVDNWKRGNIKFNPDIAEEQIGLSSIDLRLGFIFSQLMPREDIVIKPASKFDPTNLVETIDLRQQKHLGDTPIFQLKPKQFCLAFTLEEISIASGLAASVQGKSSLARAGLSIHLTAPHIHPGFMGHIVLEMYNFGPWKLEFEPARDLICQLILYQVTQPVSEIAIDKLGTYMEQKSPFPRKD